MLGPASDELDTNELVCVLERMVRHLLSSKSKTIKSPKAAQNAANRDPTPFQTLSIYRDAMKEDELALRFDTMTLGMFPVQIMRIIQNALRRSNDYGIDGLDECYAVAATIALLKSSNSFVVITGSGNTVKTALVAPAWQIVSRSAANPRYARLRRPPRLAPGG
jgi:hypothetical protein